MTLDFDSVCPTHESIHVESPVRHLFPIPSKEKANLISQTALYLCRQRQDFILR